MGNTKNTHRYWWGNLFENGHFKGWGADWSCSHQKSIYFQCLLLISTKCYSEGCHCFILKTFLFQVLRQALMAGFNFVLWFYIRDSGMSHYTLSAKAVSQLWQNLSLLSTLPSTSRTETSDGKPKCGYATVTHISCLIICARTEVLLSFWGIYYINVF